MDILFLFCGFITGWFLCIVIEKISCVIDNKENTEKYTKFTTRNIIVILISGVLFLISFFQIGLSDILIKALVLDSILIVISFIDIDYRIIPNKLIVFTLAMGVIFSFIDNISFLNGLVGMLIGGGLLLILALVPGALGGGDIKLMFVLGIFLGAKGVLVALFLAFVIASIISLLLLLFKIIKRKDYIPFGPFLALGTYIAFHFINII